MNDSTKFPSFSFSREHLDENGNWNPVDEEAPLEGGFQLNLYGSREHYLALAEAIRKFAMIDTESDGDYHHHLEGIKTVDGRVRFHVIVRKDDAGDSIHRNSFPPQQP